MRRDIEACIDAYQGIAALARKGDQFQWGGRLLCEGGCFPLPGGRARFLSSEPPDARLPPGRFALATRRGKHWNSRVQVEVAPLTGAARDHLFMNVDDMRELGLSQDQTVLVQSAHGTVRARAFAADVTRGHVQMHWPEANPLIAAGVRDPGGLVPGYNAEVQIEPLGPAGGALALPVARAAPAGARGGWGRLACGGRAATRGPRARRRRGRQRAGRRGRRGAARAPRRGRDARDHDAHAW